MDNKLTSKDLKALASLEDLQSLSLGGNDLNTFEEVESLKGLKKLF